jgi:hypothetical protein
LEGPADLAAGKVGRFLEIDLPPFGAALRFIVGAPTSRYVAIVGLSGVVFVILDRRAACRLVQGEIAWFGGESQSSPANQY